jgi:predicted ATPase
MFERLTRGDLVSYKVKQVMVGRVQTYEWTIGPTVSPWYDMVFVAKHVRLATLVGQESAAYPAN